MLYTSLCRGAIGEPGSSAFMFDYKGVLEMKNHQLPDLDATEFAIDVGAEDVTVDEITSTWKLLCDPRSLKEVIGAVKGKEVVIDSISLDYIPKSLVLLNDAEYQKAEELVEQLNDHPEVVAVHSNFSHEDDTDSD